MENLAQLDLSALVRGEGPGGFGPRRLTLAAGKLPALRERWEALTPLPSDEAIQNADALAATLRTHADHLSIIGHPSALRACRALAGDAPGLSYIGRPADMGTPKGAYLLIDGTFWADRLAEQIVAAGCPLAVASAEADVPPDGWWIYEAQPGESRLNLFSAPALVAAAFADRPAAALIQGARAIDHRCESNAVLENPAAIWAACLRLSVAPLEGSEIRSVLLHLSADPLLDPLTAWTAATQAAILGEGIQGPVRTPISLSGQSAALGDEDAMAAIAFGLRDRLVVLWQGRSDPQNTALIDATRTFCTHSRTPCLNLKLRADLPAIGAAARLSQRATALAALFLGNDPSLSESRERWRSLLDHQSRPPEGEIG